MRLLRKENCEKDYFAEVTLPRNLPLSSNRSYLIITRTALSASDHGVGIDLLNIIEELDSHSAFVPRTNSSWSFNS